MNEFISAIITAGGSGTRMGADVPKLEIKIDGHTILEHTLSKFIDLKYIDEIIIVAPKELLAEYKTRYEDEKIKVVEGGNSREESTFRGLCSISDRSTIVICHDGARPLVDERIIEDSIKSAIEFGSAVAAVKSKDTIKRADKTVIETLNRDELYNIQTPQTFKTEILKSAYKNYKRFKVTDDASLVENLGKEVYLIEGSYKNIKVTTPDDLIIAKAFLENEKEEKSCELE